MLEKTIGRTKLRKLGDDCMLLMDKVTEFNDIGTKKKIERIYDNLANAVRKVQLANELMNKEIICVTGLQGSGKSTLMKNFYELPYDTLVISEGRGEKFPVIITEKEDCHEPTMYRVVLVKTENGIEQCEEKITSEEFKKIAKGEIGEAGVTSKTMYLEVQVPYKRLNTDAVSFLLLPGYEKEKKEYWQNLLDFSVQCSDTAIFLYSDTDFASAENEKLRKDIEARFQNKKIVYGITYSDDRDQKKNNELRENCIRVMNIPSYEEDRVICVGSYTDKAENEKWIKKLTSALENYCINKEDAETKCKDYMKEMIDDIESQLFSVEEIIDESMDEDEYEEIKNSKKINEFTKRKNKLKKVVEKELDKCIEHACNKSLEKLDTILDDKKKAKELGLDERTINQVKNFMGIGNENQKVAKRRVEYCIKDDSENEYGYLVAVKNAANSILLVSKDQSMTKTIIENKVGLLSDTPESKEQLMIASKSLYDDMATLLKTDRTGDVLLKNTNEKEIMDVLAECSAYYFCNSFSELIAGKPETLDLTSNLTLMDVESAAWNGKRFAMSIFGVLGAADYFPDGKFDGDAFQNIGEVISTMNVPLKTATGIFAVATATGKIWEKWRDMNKKNKEIMKKEIENIYAAAKNVFLDSYDDAMERIEDLLRNNIERDYGLNRDSVAQHNSKVQIEKIKSDLVEIRKELKNNGQFGYIF